MILAVDVGNTETVLGLFEGIEPVERWRISTERRRTADEHALMVEGLLGERRPDRLVVGSVVSVLDRAWRGVADRLGVECVELDGRAELPVRLDVDDVASVGADRIANTMAALRLYGRDTVVVDLGTATTFDCVTAHGVFLGGVIAPGPRAGMERLAQTAARLPLAEIEAPSRVVGRNTRDCLTSGVFYTIVDAIDGIVERILEEWRPEDPLVVATGGLAGELAPHCATVDRVEPALTLVGLAAADAWLRGGNEGDKGTGSG